MKHLHSSDNDRRSTFAAICIEREKARRGKERERNVLRNSFRLDYHHGRNLIRGWTVKRFDEKADGSMRTNRTHERNRIDNKKRTKMRTMLHAKTILHHSRRKKECNQKQKKTRCSSLHLHWSRKKRKEEGEEEERGKKTNRNAGNEPMLMTMIDALSFSSSSSSLHWRLAKHERADERFDQQLVLIADILDKNKSIEKRFGNESCRKIPSIIARFDNKDRANKCNTASASTLLLNSKKERKRTDRLEECDSEHL